MDYEFRIKQAELELAHFREMQALRGDRLDSHDRSIDAMKQILDGILVTVNRTAANLDVLTVQVGRLETRVDQLAVRVDMLAVQTGKLELKMDQLIDALMHGRLNGGASGKA